MTYRKLHASLIALAICLALTGCIGGDSSGGKRGRTASRGRMSIGKNKNANMAKARKGAGNIADFSPEGSMERDLAQLREHEKKQERMVKEMKGSLDKGSDQVRREEEKLADIRRRIHNYDTAINRYEVAAKSRPPREAAGEPSVVPREMFEERGAGATPVAYESDDYVFDNPYASAPRRETRTLYSVEVPTASSRAPVREYRSDTARPAAGTGFEQAAYGYDDAADVEQVLYTPPTGADRPFAGAPVGRSNHASRQSAEVKRRQAEEWKEPDSLFSQSSTPSAAPQYRGVAAREAAAKEAENSLDQQVRAKAAAAANKRQLSAMAPPAQGSNAKVTPPKTEIRMQPKQQPAATSVKPPQSLPPASVDDEVFTPDLFLGN